MRPALLVLPLLAACTAGGVAPAPRGGPAEPRQAVLYENTLTVVMSDRSLCAGPRGRQGRTWSGTLAGCPHLWPYAAALPPGRVARLPLVAGAQGAARVEVTGPDGKVWRFGR